MSPCGASTLQGRAGAMHRSSDHRLVWLDLRLGRVATAVVSTRVQRALAYGGGVDAS